MNKKLSPEEVQQLIDNARRNRAGTSKPAAAVNGSGSPQSPELPTNISLDDDVPPFTPPRSPPRFIPVIDVCQRLFAMVAHDKVGVGSN
jgi:hypothetical protein